MRKLFPRIAMGLGLVMALVLFRFGPGQSSDGAELPLLTALFISEFGFLLTFGSAIYCGLEIHRGGGDRPMWSQLLGNAILALVFVLLGLQAWQEVAAA